MVPLANGTVPFDDYCQACLNSGCTKDGLCPRCQERVAAVTAEFKKCRPDLASDRAFTEANETFNAG